jgi:hypothetical protein
MQEETTDLEKSASRIRPIREEADTGRKRCLRLSADGPLGICNAEITSDGQAGLKCTRIACKSEVVTRVLTRDWKMEGEILEDQ